MDIHYPQTDTDNCLISKENVENVEYSTQLFVQDGYIIIKQFTTVLGECLTK